ncbi:unnamed protein product [Protopolystoma xenopodis]|uniref:Uncharacterized protein n=1 Tax=Protopolystoma xenopodis TaxID=117903 RepID=A0A448XQZ6_9PLAT|nr:unnamed protein product [Protopolystoma xenopodis]
MQPTCSACVRLEGSDGAGNQFASRRTSESSLPGRGNRGRSGARKGLPARQQLATGQKRHKQEAAGLEAVVGDEM